MKVKKPKEDIELTKLVMVKRLEAGYPIVSKASRSKKYFKF